MIEIKSITHTMRIFATKLSWTDLFRIVFYNGYRGDPSRIPFFYHIVHGHSAETDLDQPLADLLAAMKSNTRNEIRRAEREGCRFAVVENIEEFVPFYNSFCESKGLNDYTSRSRMEKYPHVLMTKAIHANKTLAMHAMILDDVSHTAMLLYSCSPRFEEGVDRKMIGWGNKFLHLKDMAYLKEAGYKVFDWCGICTDPESPKYSIGQFKLSFGGKLIDSYVLTTPLYRLAQFVLPLIARVRRGFRRNKGRA